MYFVFIRTFSWVKTCIEFHPEERIAPRIIHCFTSLRCFHRCVDGLRTYHLSRMQFVNCAAILSRRAKIECGSRSNGEHSFFILRIRLAQMIKDSSLLAINVKKYQCER